MYYLAYHLRASAFRGLSIVFQRRGRGVANTIGAFSGKWTRRGKDGRQDGGKLFPHLDVPHFLARHMDTRGLVLNSDGSPSAVRSHTDPSQRGVHGSLCRASRRRVIHSRSRVF